MTLFVHTCVYMLERIETKSQFNTAEHVEGVQTMMLARIMVGGRAMTIEDVVKVDGLVCVGVPIGTPTFVEDWASAKIRDLIKDLQKLRVRVWRPPAIATQFYGASIKSRRLRPLPMPRMATHVIQSCAPAWQGTLHSPVHCTWSPMSWLSCLSTLDWVMAFTVGEWQSWFCIFLGLPLPSMCSLSATNRRCPCRRTKANRTRCHIHILACLVSLFREAGFHEG